jgi:hypothetical protein
MNTPPSTGADLAIQIALNPRAPWRPGTRDAHFRVTTGQGVYMLAITGMGVTNCAPRSGLGGVKEIAAVSARAKPQASRRSRG